MVFSYRGYRPESYAAVLKIDIKHAVKIFVRNVFDKTEIKDAGIIHQNINSAVFISYFPYGTLRRGAIGDIAL